MDNAEKVMKLADELEDEDPKAFVVLQTLSGAMLGPPELYAELANLMQQFSAKAMLELQYGRVEQ